uniref:Putative capsid protein n=1 Tax=viral metagenome TaxID=1070528 RepID=A0A6M3IDI6_9ZZZZ
MGVLRNQFTNAMIKDLYVYFWENYDETPPMYEELFDVVPSTGAYDKFTSAIGLGELLEKPEGTDLQADSPMESYTIVCKNRSFGRVIRFSKESVDDSQKGNLMQKTAGTWGRMVPYTKELFYAKFFNYGAYTAGHDVFNNKITGVIEDATGNLGYDSKPWFSTAHPDKVGNTYANYTLTRALTHPNLKTTYLTYTSTNNRDERGHIVSLMPDTLLVPPALYFTAREILESTLIPDIFDNTKNVLSAIVQPMAWQFLEDADGWYLLKRKMGLMATSRESVTIDFWQDEMSKDYFTSIYERYGGAMTNWRFAYACNIAQS